MPIQNLVMITRDNVIIITYHRLADKPRDVSLNVI